MYNHDHLHCAINFVASEQRHNGDHVAVLAQRKLVYLEVHPEISESMEWLNTKLGASHRSVS